MSHLATPEEYEQLRRDTLDCPFNGADERPTPKPQTLAAGPAQERPNLTLVFAVKQNSPEEPAQFAFSLTDAQGKEEIITCNVQGRGVIGERKSAIVQPPSPMGRFS